MKAKRSDPSEEKIIEDQKTVHYTGLTRIISL